MTDATKHAGRALFVKNKHLGDSVILTAAIEAMPEGWEIDVLCFPESKPIFQMSPRVGLVETVARGSRGLDRLLSDRAMIRRLAARRYDYIAQFSDDWRGTVLTRLLRPELSAARRAARRGRFWHASFDRIAETPIGRRRHIAEMDVDILRVSGFHDGRTAPAYRLCPPPTAEAEALSVLSGAGFGTAAAGPVLLQPATRWRFKGLPDGLWSAVIDGLSQAGKPVALIGSPFDRDDLQRIAAGCAAPPPIFVADLTLTAALMARANAVVTVDSLAQHLACAVGTPVVAVFGPTDDHAWGPWGVPHRVVARNDLSCRPCSLAGCGGSRISQCLVTLPPARIVEAAVSLLGEASAVAG